MVATVLNADTYRNVFPVDLTDDEFLNLEASILSAGRVLVPIFADEHGNILDGFSRWLIYRANTDKVASPPVVTLSGLSEEEKRLRIFELNCNRRHLTLEQRKQVAAEMLKADPARSSNSVGKATNLSHHTVEGVRSRLADMGLIPFTTARRGDDGRTQAKKRPGIVLNKNLSETRKTIAALKTGVSVTGVGSAKSVARKVQKRKYALSLRAKAPVPPDGVSLLAGDSRALLADLEPGSVDLILTDPLYQAEYGDDWRWLGEWAVRVLKPGGFLVAYSGSMFMPGHLAALLAGGLTWGNLCGVIRPNADSPKNTLFLNKLRPVFVCSNGRCQPPHLLPDVHTTPPRRTADDDVALEKDCHEYQQRLGGVLHWLTHLSRPGDLVADPFGGSFTTAVAAVLMGRRFVGSDLDEGNVEIGRRRLADLDGERRRLTPEERAKYGLAG
jgi:hypothetical protein